MQAELPSSQGKAIGKGHEGRDVRVKAIIFIALLHTLGLFVMLGFMLRLLQFLEKRKRAEESAGMQSALAISEKFPEPRLQVSPRADMERLRERETAELNRYSWVDRKAGIAQIPIERAMELLARRGLPVRGQTGEIPPSRTSLDLIRERARQQATPSEKEAP